MRDLCVLIVEDEPDGAEVLEMMLNSTGVQTVIASTAEQALEELRAAPHGFDAAIVDLALPEMDGVELMQVIRQQPAIANLPLLAVTAYHTPELKAKALDLGFDAYLAKPLDTTLFMRMLESLMS